MIFLISQDGEFAVRADLIKELYIDEAPYDVQRYHLRVVVECDDDDITVGMFKHFVTATNALKRAVENITNAFSTEIMEDIDNKAEVSE